MKLYCENCGKQLKHYRKAIANLGIIVDLVAYHECSEEPVPFKIDPSAVFIFEPIAEKDKFVKSLNDLETGIGREIGHSHSEGKSLRSSSMTGTDNLRDRRFDQEEKAKSSAPPSVLSQINSMINTNPEHSLNEPSDDSEMGG